MRAKQTVQCTETRAKAIHRTNSETGECPLPSRSMGSGKDSAGSEFINSSAENT